MARRTDQPERAPGSLMSRRRLLSGAAAGMSAAALAACGPDAEDWTAPGRVEVTRVREVPDRPDRDVWMETPFAEVAMDSQVMVLPYRTEPLTRQMKVRAIHDGTRIGFRLEWDDDEPHSDTIPCDGFRDACAVLLAPGEGDETVRVMGSAEQAATLLHWKADWQRDVEEGVRGVRDAFPNVSVDEYPPLAVPPGEVTPASYVEAGATQWLPGMHVGNPISVQTRETCVEKILAKGPGSVTSTPTQNATGWGVRTDDGWRVALVRPLDAVDEDEVSLSPGAVYTCAFALWSGGHDDSGGRKTPSKVALRLEMGA